MIKLGYMNYANIFPIFWNLEQNPDYEFIKGVPSFLNSKLRAGELDASPVSSFEYLNKPDSYYILPSTGICANRKVQSVILFSDYPIEQLDGKKVFRTADSLASINLLKVIFEKFYDIS
ncbi:MAG: hypothetical protein LBV09_04430, partial [Deferribacteraceae bacterium]|nr:hypothetical protein [Deferribacteraceae bacterium]